MATRTAAQVTDIQDAATARWLSKQLEPARADVQALPSGEAVDRIRARVFGDAATRKTSRSIAA